MSAINTAEPIRVGVLTDEPLRQAGIASIFEHGPEEGYAPLTPVIGSIEELLDDSTLEFLVVDLHSATAGMEAVQIIRHNRPGMKLIVIGPEGNDKLIMDLIVAGARAYLDLKASPRIVRQAVEVVTSGSIWAPRRLLSQLIDRLIGFSDTSLVNEPPRLTDRERQVLELILTASSNREIAHKLGIEERTVQAHVGRLMRKTGADNRIELLMRASDPSLVQIAGSNERRQEDRRQADRRQGIRRGIT
ncbi:MAG: response regulator transcription factor [Terracidiphilus sp.]|jgi:DNA-binding NarL/FixJ family response regulator